MIKMIKDIAKIFITKLNFRRIRCKKWSNVNNGNFYQKMRFEDFFQNAIQGGLDTGIDVKNLEKYITNANSILEVGAGYGRVLTHILNLGYTGKLVAIERDKKFCQFLQSQFNSRADVFCEDIFDFKPNKKFDLILWMWGSICEFSKAEQLKVISQLASMLNKNGHLILDTIPIECASVNATALSPHYRVIKTHHGKDYCYLPSDDDIVQFAKKTYLVHHKDLIYRTTTNRKRRLSIFCAE